MTAEEFEKKGSNREMRVIIGNCFDSFEKKRRQKHKLFNGDSQGKVMHVRISSFSLSHFTLLGYYWPVLPSLTLTFFLPEFFFS